MFTKTGAIDSWGIFGETVFRIRKNRINRAGREKLDRCLGGKLLPSWRQKGAYEYAKKTEKKPRGRIQGQSGAG
ncbi:MAG: hypothetical protein KKB90_06120, partial [Actinobacteria bacterium]|nr:hypothetical protein [Actinomycetota bacterium]MBU4218523.1 hypothetical protein [Actinomycetota bacterium]MBU4360135.1 hypothetical protein [Actinomycetota bacterium]MCG2819474.1 hypothetical protein [Actinomycetes bacterium]